MTFIIVNLLSTPVCDCNTRVNVADAIDDPEKLVNLILSKATTFYSRSERTSVVLAKQYFQDQNYESNAMISISGNGHTKLPNSHKIS